MCVHESQATDASYEFQSALVFSAFGLRQQNLYDLEGGNVSCCPLSTNQFGVGRGELQFKVV